MVFEEADATKRNEAIKKLWVKDEDAVFVDPDRIWNGHAQIGECVGGLVQKFAGWVFAEVGTFLTGLPTLAESSLIHSLLGAAQVLPEGDGDHGMRVVRQAWNYGPPGDPKVFGQDIATIVDGKIKLLYAILAPDGL